MSSLLEEKLREASCIGDSEAVLALLSNDNVNVNSKNSVNGWTALHWAAKRCHEDIATILINHGANTQSENNKGERPSDLCSDPKLSALLGGEPRENNGIHEEINTGSLKFMPSYLKNPPLINNCHSEMGTYKDLSKMPTTSLPAASQIFQQANDELVLKVRLAGSPDPDFIEIEIPHWKLTYGHLLKVCCEELEVGETHVERIRKLPNTRLRKDSDVKRLVNFQELELVLAKTDSSGDKTSNCYQSISAYKNQTILY